MNSSQKVHKRVEVLQKLSQDNLNLIENTFIRNRLGSRSLREDSRQALKRRSGNFALFSCYDKGASSKIEEEYSKAIDCGKTQRKVSKSSSFRDTMSKFNIFRTRSNEMKKVKPKLTAAVKKNEEVIMKSVPEIKNETEAVDKKTKQPFWSTKNKDTTTQPNKDKSSWFKKIQGSSPLHERSGSFEFVNDIKAAPEDKNIDTVSRRKTIYCDEQLDDPVEEIFSKGFLHHRSAENLDTLKSKESEASNSTLDTGGSLNTPSFVEVLEDFERTVQMLNDESYLSDSEVYSSRKKSLSLLSVKSRKRLSSSFTGLDSPRIKKEENVKPSTLPSPFLKVLNGLIMEKKIYGSSSSAISKARSESSRSNAGSGDKWISQDEALLYSKETRPPFIIPRIKHYIPSRPVNFGNNRLRTSQDDLLFDHSPTDLPGEPLSPSIKEVRKMFEVRSQNDGYRHNMPVRNMDKGGIRLDFAIEKGFVKASSESPKFIRLPQRIGGSNEMLSHKRVNMTPIKSGSGENLVEVRGEHQSSLARNGKAKSMIGHATLGQWSPVSVQRVLPKLYDPNMHALLEGFVNRTRLTENGKKVRKNWVHNYLIMTQTSLAFYKDLKTYQITKSAMHAGTPPSPTSSSKPDLVLSLHGAVVSRCTSQHTSRYAHACIVTTAHRDQVIIQHDSPAVANHWYEEILKTINKLPSDYVCPNNNNLGGESPRDEHKSTPTSTRKNVQKGKSNNKGGDGSTEDVSDPSSEQNNVRTKLKRFFARRPTMDSLVRKGIYKDEPVFGRSLEQVSPESGLRVPDFVVRCVKAIESTEENMCTDGLYRASGNLSQVQKIRLEVDQNNMSVLDNEVDVHVLTGALKLFFRELKEPLIPCRLFHKALNASANQHRESRVKEFREIYFGIPDSNRQTLKYLLEHLLRVTSYKDKNRMHIPNIAIVFGPTLLWAPIESAHNMATDCLQQNQVIETLLTDYDLIFREDHIRRK